MTLVSRFETLEEAAEAATGLLAAALAAGVEARGQASLVATGGRTPGAVYDRLARTPLDWSRVEVTLSDERWVEPDDPASNERLVRERLLTGLAAAARLVPLKTPAAAPALAIPEVEARVKAMALPFDAVLLGMGEDGHVASLFPGMDGLAAALDPSGADLLKAAAPGAGRPPAEPRLGLTLAALAPASTLVLFMTGEAKLEAWERVVAGGDPLEMPVRALLAARAHTDVVWGP
jgi:6-phosphogluconolactonase